MGVCSFRKVDRMSRYTRKILEAEIHCIKVSQHNSQDPKSTSS